MKKVIAQKYAKYAADGWPLCPDCGLDRLYSPQALHGLVAGGDTMTLAQTTAAGMRCESCSWQSLELGGAS